MLFNNNFQKVTYNISSSYNGNLAQYFIKFYSDIHNQMCQNLPTG